MECVTPVEALEDMAGGSKGIIICDSCTMNLDRYYPCVFVINPSSVWDVLTISIIANNGTITLAYSLTWLGEEQ